MGFPFRKLSIMESVNVFIDNLKKDQDRRRQELLGQQKLKKEELDTILQSLHQLKDEKNQCVLNINKNLSSITASKHSIHKSLQETREDTRLPISNASRTHALDFFTNAMTFINTQCENSSANGVEETIDTDKLTAAIQTSTENFQKEIVKVRNKLAVVETVIDSIPGLTELITPGNNEEEESALDVSITLT